MSLSSGSPAVQVDEAGVVIHLGVQHDHVLGLEQLHVVVVGARRHRRAGVEPEDTAHLQAARAEVLHEAARCGLVAAHARARHRHIRHALLGARRHRRMRPSGGSITSDVRWVRHRRAFVEPEVVVRHHPAGGVVVTAAPADRLLGEFRGFLRREHLGPSQVVRPLHRGQAAEVPHALQVGCAPRGARNGLGAGRNRRKRRNRHGHRQHCQKPLSHLPPPQKLRL